MLVAVTTEIADTFETCDILFDSHLIAMRRVRHCPCLADGEPSQGHQGAVARKWAEAPDIHHCRGLPGGRGPSGLAGEPTDQVSPLVFPGLTPPPLPCFLGCQG